MHDSVAGSDRSKYPCPVCERPCDVELTKRNKPYVKCDPCGVQLFVRGKGGIERFTRNVRAYRNHSAVGDVERPRRTSSSREPAPPEPHFHSRHVHRGQPRATERAGRPFRAITFFETAGRLP
jgi:DNA-directed RNA polymerase subunit RPC12/RpoP